MSILNLQPGVKVKFFDKTIISTTGYGYGGGGGGGGGGSSVDLLAGLQAFYKLSDTSDSSGNNNTLTTNGNVQFASGKIGLAAGFDGSSYLIKEGVSPVGTNDFSLGMWLNLTNFSSNPPVPFAGGSGGFSLAFFEGMVHIAKSNVADLYDFSSGAVTSNSWFHVLINRVGSVVTCYVNGSSVGTYDSGSVIDFTGTDYYIGAHPGPMLFTEGQIDAVGVWNRALSEGEVAALYNSGNGLELN